MEEQEQEKKNIVEWCIEHPKTTFALRAIVWTIFAAVLPFSFIAWRYDIFKKGSELQLSGWGIIAVIIVAVFAIVLIRYLFLALKPGFAKQCITGFASVVVPLIALMLIVDKISTNVVCFQQALGCTTLCEFLAIPINPFPDLIEKMRQEELDEKVEKSGKKFWKVFFDTKKDSEK